MRPFLGPLAGPLLLVAVLAATLGFFVTRSIAGDREDKTARVSVVALPPTPTPTPSPTPAPTAAPSTRRRSGSSSSGNANCPSGCECSFPPNATVVICRGGSGVRFP